MAGENNMSTIESGHRGAPLGGEHLKGVKKLALGAAAAIAVGGVGVAGARIAEVGPFSSPDSQGHVQNLPEGLPSAQVPLTTETPTASPTATETPTATPTEAVVVKLPDVINSNTVTFENLSPIEAGKLMDEAAAREEMKVPLPAILEKEGISLFEVKSKNNSQGGLGLSGDKPGEYNLSSLVGGEVTQAEFVAGSSVASIEITTKEGTKLAYIVPGSSSSQFKLGDQIALGDIILSINYDPNTPKGKEFVGDIQRQIEGVPSNTMAIIAFVDSSGNGANIDRDNILTLNGSPVVVLPSDGK